MKIDLKQIAIRNLVEAYVNHPELGVSALRHPRIGIAHYTWLRPGVRQGSTLHPGHRNMAGHPHFSVAS